MNSSQLTNRIKTRTVYADYISQREREAQGCASNTAYSPGGLPSSTLLDIQQGFRNTTPLQTAEILSNAACPGFNNPPTPPTPGMNGPPTFRFLTANTSYLQITTPNALVFGTNDFTVEWYQYMSSNSTSACRIFSIHPWNETQIGMSIEDYSLGANDRRLFVWYYTGSSFTSIAANSTILNAWHHIAVVGSGGNNIKVFVDGSNLMDQSVTYNIQNPGNWRFAIGAEEGGGSYFDGYLTNMRALNGTALYTTNFTVPTLPLGNITNTALLLLTATSGTAFQDSSSNNYTVENAGSGLVTWSSNSPDFPF